MTEPKTATPTMSTMNKTSPSCNLEDHIDADRFVPQHKLLMWEMTPDYLLTLGHPYLHSKDICPFQHRWIRNPKTRASMFDLCTFNILNLIPDCIEYMQMCHMKNEMPSFDVRFFKHHGSIHKIMNCFNQILQSRERLKQLEMKLSKNNHNHTNNTNNTTRSITRNMMMIEDQCRGSINNDCKYDEMRVLQTTPETLAIICDEIQSQVERNAQEGLTLGINRYMELHRYQRIVCKDYLWKMQILMDIERIQALEDIKSYDMYSCKFDCIEIPPPRRPINRCSACLKNIKDNPNNFCAYHTNLSLSKDGSNNKSNARFERLEIRQGKQKPSMVNTFLQFMNLEKNLKKMRSHNDRSCHCIIGYLTVPGIAENRPLVCVGDLLRLRFDREEIIGEVRVVTVKTESVMVMLPLPDLHKTNGISFIKALTHPKNRPRELSLEPDAFHDGRFDVRFGLFSSKAHDIFRATVNFAETKNIDQIMRVLAPSPFLSKIQKKTLRRPQLGIFEWAQNLNIEQKHAVSDIVRKNHGEAPYIIYGPPGTGKTMTVCESIFQLLTHDQKIKILVCAPSDAACDVIAKRLLPVLPKKGGRILRVNWWARSTDSLPPILLGCSPLNESGFFIIPGKEEIMDASVVICQCFVAGCLDVGINPENSWMDKHFTHVFIDESSQSFEFESLIPIFKVNKECSIILSGDPKQLGPITRSSCASSNGLCLSLQERLMGLSLYQETSNFAVITTLLDNYRSHDALLRIPNELFYAGALRCKASPNITSICKDFELLRDGNRFPLMAYDVNGIEQSKIDTPSFFNLEECNSIVKIIKALLSSPHVEVHSGQIAVITCFRAQVLKLRQILRESNLPTINVGAVEDFQGQETSVVLISTVLTKDQKRWKTGSNSGLGFMTDPRRFNVAITRASALCIIVGRVEFLKASGSYWASLIEHIRLNGGISGESQLAGVNEDINELEDYGIDMLINHIAELDLLGAGHEMDRYDLAMRGYFEDSPEWKICL